MRWVYKPIILVWILLSSSLIIRAQLSENLPIGKANPFVIDSFKTMIGFDFGIHFGSNSVDNQFAQKMAFGGHIQSSRIEDIYNNIRKRGRVNVDVTGGLFYFQDKHPLLERDGWNWMASVSQRWTGVSNFDEDVFGMLFRGNKPYAGSTMNWENTTAFFMHYAKYGVGMHKRWVKEGVQTKGGFLLSYIQGLDYVKVDVKNARLFTEATGQYIDMDLDYEVTRADRGRKFLETIGNGAAVDGFYSTTLKNGIFVEAGFNDLGFVSYGDLGQFQKDTTGVYFEGYRITSSSGSFKNVLDSLREVVSADEVRNSATVLLPTVVYGRIGKRLAGVLTADVLIRYTLQEESIPYTQLRVLKKIPKGYYGLSFSYGGQERSGRLGLHYHHLILDKLSIYSLLEGPEAYLSPKSFQGMQLRLGAAYLL